MFPWKKYRESFFWLIGLAAFVGALLWADDKFYGPGSEAHQNASEEEALPNSTLAVRPDGRSYELHYESRQEQPEAKFLGRSSETWIALLTLVLAASTIALWLETRRLAHHAEREAREARRPVLLALPHTSPSFWNQRGPVVDFEVKNVGKSVAFISSFIGEAALLPNAAAPPHPSILRDAVAEGRRVNMVRGLTSVQVKQTRHLRYWPELPFDESTQADHRADRISAYFYGLIVFYDANGHKREAGVCYRLRRQDDPRGEPEALVRVVEGDVNYDKAIE